MNNKITSKACDICGLVISANTSIAKKKVVFSCRSETAHIKNDAQSACIYKNNKISKDVLVAINAIVSNEGFKRQGEHGRKISKRYFALLFDYSEKVVDGEPSIAWYRSKLESYSSSQIAYICSFLPYMKRDNLRLNSITHLHIIDRYITSVRSKCNSYYADLLSDYIDSKYETLEICYQNGLYGNSNPIKLVTVAKYAQRISYYLVWLCKEGFDSLQNTGRSTFDIYVSESKLRSFYEVSEFIDFVRKKHPFVQPLKYSVKNKKKPVAGFKVLTIEQARTAFNKICTHSEPVGKALALLSLIYSQTILNSLNIKISDLVRDEETNAWKIARKGFEEFTLIDELSCAIDECLQLISKKPSSINYTNPYLFPGRWQKPLCRVTGDARVCGASGGITASVLRRTGVINIFRGGQKTAGSVVLRDVLMVSPPTIHRAIKMTGDSVNAPLPLDEAEALKKAFLADGD